MMKIFKAVLGLFVTLCILVAGLWLWDNRTVDPEVVDSVSAEALSAAILRQSPEIVLGQTNVVMAVVCTMRKDRLEPYGHPKPTSPFLDQLAKKSVVLNRHFAQAPWTRPSMGALFTGVWPRALQLDNPGARGSLEMVLREEHETLAEALKTQGYRTIGSTGNPNLKAQFGLAQGLDHNWEPESTYAEDQLKIDGFKQVDFLMSELEDSPAEQPVYMRLVLTDTHQPRQVETRYLNLFHQGGGPPGRRANYDASVRKVDAILAELFTRVMNARPDTLFVVASDHGEGLRYPTHHGKGHGNHLYETHIGSPSIWNHPSLAPQRFDGLTMNIDVKPTILGLLGATNTHKANGRDISATVRGEGQWSGHPYAFAETFYGRSNKATIISNTHQLVRRHRKKKRPAVLETLHATEDALAEVDLMGTEPLVLALLRTELDTWLNSMGQEWEEAGEPLNTTLSPELLEQLEAIGYIE